MQAIIIIQVSPSSTQVPSRILSNTLQPKANELSASNLLPERSKCEGSEELFDASLETLVLLSIPKNVLHSLDAFWWVASEAAGVVRPRDWDELTTPDAHARLEHYLRQALFDVLETPDALATGVLRLAGVEFLLRWISRVPVREQNSKKQFCCC